MVGGFCTIIQVILSAILQTLTMIELKKKQNKIEAQTSKVTATKEVISNINSTMG